jgi:hypothetical protein
MGIFLNIYKHGGTLYYNLIIFFSGKPIKIHGETWGYLGHLKIFWNILG